MPSPKIQRALISVSDKTGLADFAAKLIASGVRLLSTGGSRQALERAGLPVTDISDHTGFPEMMDGRLKTLHPKVHGGILCRHDRPEDMASAAAHGIEPFELVVVNLYPFRETVARPDVDLSEAIENIDIGGPTLIRGAAKNHAFVTVVTSATQYDQVAEQVRTAGSTTEELRRELAAKAFAHTASYDSAIATYLRGKFLPAGDWPQELSLALDLKTPLRYGENPHQQAALFASGGARPGSLVHGELLHGKELSYNNLLDLSAALGLAKALPVPSVAVLKHNNPCGAATAATLGEATQKAWDGDPLSAFGSVLGFNAPVDEASAECLAEFGKFVEAIVAPDFTPQALEILTTKPKWKANVRLLKAGYDPNPGGGWELRAVDGGYLVQNADNIADDASSWRVVTRRNATQPQLDDLRFAWDVCRHVKSNAIVLVREGMLVGVGAGQMSRVDSVEIAIRKAGDRARGAVLASDAFFPFDDSIGAAAAAGIVGIVQPGGSKRDEEVIEACDRHQIPMLFTGQRHFRH